MESPYAGKEINKGCGHVDKIVAMYDNLGIMTRSIPKKSQTMLEISHLLGFPEILPTVGSSVPSVFFTSIAAEMGLPTVNGMPAMAKKIIENAHLAWHEEFSSELAPSGGGGTVTALGLLQVKNAVLVWQGKIAEPLPSEIIFEDWQPSEKWLEIRKSLPKELREVIMRPGAAEFRDLVLTEYDKQCVVTGYRAIEAIDIAHIVPYYGPESDELQNAIPLRADIHRLFDQGLVRIEYDSSIRKYMVKIHDFIFDDYSDYHNKALILPHDALSVPSRSALLEKQKLHKHLWQTI